MAGPHLFLPEDMITDVLSRLPVKSLIRFKSVSKRLISFITDPKFVASHLQRSNKNPSLLFTDYRRGPRSTTISLLHNTKPTTSQRVCIPRSMETKYMSNPGKVVSLDIRIVGSCGGLLCVLLINRDREYVMWNPAIRNFRPVKCPEQCLVSLAEGFGYSTEINDYKLVRIGRQVGSLIRTLVFSWRTDSWTVVEDNGLLNGAFCPSYDGIGVSMKGELYWSTRRSTEELLYSEHFLLAFDMVKDEFRRIDFPHMDEIILKGYNTWEIANFKDSLLSFVDSVNMKATNTDFWILKKNGRYWEKLFSINQTIYPKILTWREKIVIAQTSKNQAQLSTLLYDPIRQNATDQLPLPLCTRVFDYVESLASVDGTNSII